MFSVIFLLYYKVYTYRTYIIHGSIDRKVINKPQVIILRHNEEEGHERSNYWELNPGQLVMTTATITMATQ